MHQRAIYSAAAILLASLLSAGCIESTPETRDLGLISVLRDDGRLSLRPGVEANFWIGEDLLDPGTAHDWEIVWAFGDGTTAVGNPVRHAYTTEGRYIVTAMYDGLNTTRGLFVDLELEHRAVAPLRSGLLVSEEAGEFSYLVRAGNRGTSAEVGLEDSAPDTLHTVHVEIVHPDGTIEGPRQLGSEHWSWSLGVGADEGAEVGEYRVRYWTEGPLDEQPLFIRALVFF